MFSKCGRGIALVALLCLIGCVPSLHAIFTDKDCVFDPDMVGAWQAEGAHDSWSFAKKDDKSYDLVYTDKDGLKANFIAHMVKLTGATFLDLYPGQIDPAIKVNPFYAVHFLPCHMFALVISVKPDLQLAFADPSWIKDFLAANPAALKHEIVQAPDGPEVVVQTASTAELQKFWGEHAGTAAAFPKPMLLKRQAPPAVPKETPQEPPKEAPKEPAK